MDSNFLRATLALTVAAHQQSGTAAHFADGVCNQQRSAAGRIQLSVMMGFHNFDIRLWINGSRFFCKLCQQCKMCIRDSL